MLDTHMQPQFTYNPKSPLYQKRVPLPCSTLSGAARRRYDRSDADREAVISILREEAERELRHAIRHRGAAAPASFVVYDDLGNVLHEWTRADLGV